MRRHAPLAALGALCIVTISILSLLFAPRPLRQQPLSVAALVKTPVMELAVALGAAPKPEPLDTSPAKLDIRVKTASCTLIGPYPDHACTPGAVIATTSLDALCTSGYTKTVRNVSTSLKKKVYKEYGITYPQPTGSYEADHLIPLELGGNNDIANLFPEAALPAPGFKEKDLVENYLHAQVCGGEMALGRAQEAIATDWLKVYNGLSEDELQSLKAAYASWADKN